VDGLAYTHWTPANERRSWFSIDLGGVVSVGRVTLKQTQASALYRIELQISSDGSTFTAIPGTVRLSGINPLESIAFTPVAARFVRVRMDKLLGEPASFEEIAVNPL